MDCGRKPVEHYPLHQRTDVHQRGEDSGLVAVETRYTPGEETGTIFPASTRASQPKSAAPRPNRLVRRPVKEEDRQEEDEHEAVDLRVPRCDEGGVTMK